MAERKTEPGIEDILASIKKVIAEDTREALAANAGDDTPDKDDAEDDILELTGELESTAEEPLIGQPGRGSMRESLEALSAVSAPRTEPETARPGETSLDAMVREMLRPMLAKWLDDNLPRLVEEMVAKEITRITREE